MYAQTIHLGLIIPKNLIHPERILDGLYIIVFSSAFLLTVFTPISTQGVTFEKGAWNACKSSSKLSVIIFFIILSTVECIMKSVKLPNREHHKFRPAVLKRCLAAGANRRVTPQAC
jgi:hypothetical protein